MATKKFAELRKRIVEDPVRAERLARAESDVAEEYRRYQLTLAQLRRIRNLTQAQLAKALQISQPEVSRIEHQSDVYLSTLRSYVAATGGDLDLVARFGDDSASLTLDDLFEDSESSATPIPVGPLGESQVAADIPLGVALAAIDGGTRVSALRSIATSARDRGQIQLACVLYALAAEASLDDEGKQGAAQALGATGGLARKHHASRLAEVLWRRSLEFDPTNIRSRSALGQLLHHRGNYREAIEHLRMVAPVDNRSSLFLGWSLLFVGLDRGDEAAVGEGLSQVVNALRTWSYNAPRVERSPWLRQLRRLASLGERFLPEVEQLIAFANANNQWREVTMADLASAEEADENLAAAEEDGEFADGGTETAEDLTGIRPFPTHPPTP
jgi:transcriptional regulator with XRE-family HTH domain